ncbi:hypothetical protein V494_04307 [Pseudogymnoascus sp. VKM F-4513 (FW-928)]|nr:hypothetical protein V494_04307 [Pseudogymnoascus sp. VKM F-4513 (FW-928)]
MSHCRCVCGFPIRQLASLTPWSRALITVSRRPISSQAITISNAAAHILPPNVPIEEEQNPDYDLRHFYPARVGETVNGKYEIISKLGFGTGSTVWLAEERNRWPWQPSKYMALKITNCFEGDRKSANEELAMSRYISQIQSKYENSKYVRVVEDSFVIPGPFGEHLCLAFEPLREPLWMLGRHLGTVGLSSPILKAFLKLILQGLDFLHSECRIIHTDLKADNFLLGFEDSSVIAEYVNAQRQNPGPYKDGDERRVYQSQPDFGRFRKGTGVLKISDFGAAVFGDTASLHYHDIQLEQFSAPEVLLGAGWTYSADIWNLGMVLWELLEDISLIDGIGPENKYSRPTHFAQMVRLLGPPPEELLGRANRGVHDDLYSEQGKFKHPRLMPSKDFTFESRTTSLDGEDKRLFIEFAQRMLRWRPEERATAKELYGDPWLSSP